MCDNTVALRASRYGGGRKKLILVLRNKRTFPIFSYTFFDMVHPTICVKYQHQHNVIVVFHENGVCNIS